MWFGPLGKALTHLHLDSRLRGMTERITLSFLLSLEEEEVSTSPRGGARARKPCPYGHAGGGL